MEVKLVKNCDCPPECSMPVVIRVSDDVYTIKCNNCNTPYKLSI